jgi:hypothetical protein
MATVNSQSQRLLIVTRRFWPHTDDSCQRLMHWASGLKQRGIQPTILTSRWSNAWPDLCEIRNLTVHRLLPAPHSNWNESYLQKNFVQWIATHLDQLDAIYVDRADALLQVLTSKGIGWGKPILSRFAPRESSLGLAPATRLPPVAMADAVRRTQMVIVNSPSDHRFLVSQGVHDSNIARFEDPPPVWLTRSADERLRARRSLVVPDKTALMVHVGACAWPELRNVLSHVCDLLDTGALVRMWIINPNTSYTPIYEFLKDRGWHREILIFDGFDDLEEIAQAADLAWFTNPHESMQFTLPLFLAASVPVLVQESGDLPPWLKELLESSTFGSPTDLALKLHQWYAGQVDASHRAAKRRSAYFQHCSSIETGRMWKEALDRVSGAARA